MDDWIEWEDDGVRRRAGYDEGAFAVQFLVAEAPEERWVSYPCPGNAALCRLRQLETERTARTLATDTEEPLSLEDQVARLVGLLEAGILHNALDSPGPDDGGRLEEIERRLAKLEGLLNVDDERSYGANPADEELPPAARVVEWEPLRDPVNLAASALEVDDRTYPGRFVLTSRGPGACWNERTRPLAPPEPGLVPARSFDSDLWTWEKPDLPGEDSGAMGEAVETRGLPRSDHVISDAYGKMCYLSGVLMGATNGTAFYNLSKVRRVAEDQRARIPAEQAALAQKIAGLTGNPLMKNDILAVLREGSS